MQSSHAPILWEINKRMQKFETPKVKNFTQAVERMQADDSLALVMEYASAKFIVASSCDLMMTKPFSNHAAYGIGLSKSKFILR